jgi:tetratricopeptide (TPR) repeat protein
MPVADTLAGFLRALGVPGPEIPPDTEERAARYRSLLAGRRMLVVLDNAGTVEQARALLPGSRSCVTVITSRDALAGLVARDGARRLDLDLLPADEAGILLTRLIGDRARAQPEAIAALATACARLPLALRVAAELVATRPSTPVADLVTELADEQQRLDLLEAGGDPRTAVRAVFSWSFRHLDPATGNAFRLLGVHPGPDLEPHAIAALTGGTLAQTRRQLDQLARAHLISATATGRYSLHDLLGTYARELATDHDGPDAIHIALTRLLDHYLHTAATAMDALYPGEANRHRRPRVPAPAIPAPAIPGPAVTDQATARAWLDAERATLVAVTAYSAAHGWPGHATRLAATLHDYLDIAGHLPEAITIHDSAYRAARAAGDRAAEALALSDICSIYQRQGRYQQVIDQLPRALELYREIGDLKGEARVMCNLGLVESQSGRYEQAIDYYRRAIAAYRQLGQPGHGARTLNNLGFVERNIGLYDEAADHLEQAVELGHEFGDETAAAHALINLGITRVSQRRYGQAMAHLQQALELTRQAGYRAGEAFALSSMAAVDRRQGRYEQAGERGRKALALSRRIGDQACEADALNGLAELSFATGQHARARTEYAEAIKIARRNGDNHELARSLDGLGQACLALGDPGLARQHWEEALVLYTSLGWPEADQIRARLAAAPA